jgi:hypothetical protein
MSFGLSAGTWLAIGAIAVGAGTAVDQRNTAKKAAGKQEKADQVRQRVEAIRARNDKAKQIQEMQIRQANAASQAQAEGSSGSSAVSGIQSSLTAQAGSNIGMINTQLSAGKAITKLNQDTQKILDKGQFKSNMAGVAQSALGAASSRTEKPTQQPPGYYNTEQ